MNVTISAECEEFVRRKLASGHFNSAEEVVLEGLRSLEQRDARWREQIEVGLKEAREGKLLTPDEVRQSMAEKKAAWFRERSK